MCHVSTVATAKSEFTDGVVKLISGKLPIGCQVDFDSIVLTTKFPISVKATKRGKNVRIPHGVIVPKKNVDFNGNEIINETLVQNGVLSARFIDLIKRKGRCSNQHHRFMYKIRKGNIKGDEIAA